MAKPTSLIDQIAASIPESQSGRPWWAKLQPEHERMVGQILEAWKAGRFGSRKMPAARAISKALSANGVKIGPQGVLAWLQRSE